MRTQVKGYEEEKHLIYTDGNRTALVIVMLGKAGRKIRDSMLACDTIFARKF